MLRQLKKWLFDPTPLGLLLIVAILVVIASLFITFALPAKAELPQAVTSQAWGPVSEMSPIWDALPRTEMVEEQAPVIDVKKLMLTGRLARGIYKVRTVGETSPFWFCGKPYKGQEAWDLSFKIAWIIIDAAENASTTTAQINVWELAGLACNESGFDICTLGFYPRQAAYRWKILKRRRLTVSHTREDVERAIAHPRMKAWFPAFDLGGLQTLDIYYHADKRGQGEKSESKDLLSWEGFRWQAEYFHSLMIRYNTKTPSLYWPGHKAKWKLAKVRRFARRLGARPDEIFYARKRVLNFER